MTHLESEHELVAAAQNGDKAALGRLLLSYYDRLAGFIAPKIPKSLQSVVAVEDILQQTFSKAHQDIKRFEYRGSGSLSAWLQSIAERRYQDIIKAGMRKKRGGDHVQVHPSADDSSVGQFLESFSDGISTPSKIVAKKEAIQAFHVALAQLPPDYQRVIQLRFLDGLSIEDTAQEMNRTPASIRSLADRAKKLLRGEFGALSAYLSRG